MTLRTGTSRTGVVRKYYACSTCARMGKSACKGAPSAWTLSTASSLITCRSDCSRMNVSPRFLAAAFGHRVEKAVEVDTRVATLQHEAVDAADKLKRLYRMVEDGVAELDDILRERIASLKLDRERAQTTRDRIQIQATPAVEIPLK